MEMVAKTFFGLEELRIRKYFIKSKIL